VHIEDISRAFLAILEAPREAIHNQPFNVGRTEDNVQIRDVAEMVRAAVPGSELTFAADAGPDLRNYRADFSKLNDTFPGLKMKWGVREGIGELLAAYTKYALTYDDFTSPRFVRLRRLRELLDQGLLDDLLRRRGDLPPMSPRP
jgi:nucleoside-diphosphate-sugar epimerase